MKKVLLLIFSFIFYQIAFSQCTFRVLDGNGNASDNPRFVSCTPGTYTVFIQTTATIGPYLINWGDGSANSTGATLLTSGNVQHTYASTTDTFNISITDSSSNCTVNGLVVLERNPLASIQLPTGDDNFGCTPVLFRFINSSTQVSETTTFVWDFGDGSPTETYDYTNLGDTINHTYMPGIGVQSCDLEVTLTAENYCGTSTATFFPLKVWDLDEAQIDPSATLLCYPDTIVQFVNTTIRNCFPEGNTTQRYERWNFGDYWGLGYDSIIEWRPWNPPIINPPPMGYPGVGVYFVTLQDSSFCGVDDVTISIEITDPPTAVITSNKDTICAGENVSFSNGTFGGANEFQWNFDQGNGFQVLGGGDKTRTYNTPGDYTIQLVVGVAGAQGCNDTASVNLHVLTAPVADFNFDTDNECDSMTVNFTNASTGSIASYNWDFDNGTTFAGPNPPAQFYDSAGSYRVELTVTGPQSCSNVISKFIRVRQTPISGFTVSPVCLNLPSNFVDTSIAGPDPITSYNWSFGDGDTSTLRDPSHTYTAAGLFQITQIVNNGFCQDTSIIPVIIETPPTASFLADTLEGCSKLTINFTNTSSANASSFRWNFGDGSAISSARDTTHTFSNTSADDTLFIVQLIATTTFGCADTITDTVRVFPVPEPSFTSNAIADCGPVEVIFTNTTLGNNLNFIWDFGDSTPVVNTVNPTHIFENKTLFINNYQVKLIAQTATGCSDTTVSTITIYPEPIFNFTASPDSGCSPLTVRFPSVVGAVNYQWDFGDGGFASGPTPTHTFINNTTNNRVDTIQLIARNSFGCRDTSYGTILIFPNPTSIFSLDTNRGCQPLPITITNNSVGATSFNWDFGDGTTSDTADATFIKTFTNNSAFSRTNIIKLITETDNGCRDTNSRSVEVYPFIDARFTSDTVGCSPLRIRFTNNTIGAPSSGYFWDFGNLQSSVNSDPTTTYINASDTIEQYFVSLQATSIQGCVDNASKTITVYPKPIADFTVSNTQGCHPLAVTFTNNSSLADSCLWLYGDADTFKLCSPTNSHTYTNATSFFPINYQSNLVVITDLGCRDTMNQQITVNPKVTADFVSDSAGCSPFPIRFQNQSSGANQFEWFFGDGGGSPLQNPRYFFQNFGQQDTVYTTQLIVTNTNYGCKDTLEKDITVFPKPQSNFTINTTGGCQPLSVEFTNNSTISDSCSWVYGDGNSLSSCNTLTSHIFTNSLSLGPINYMPELRVYTDKGCADTLSRIIEVKPQVIADFTSEDTACSPLDATFRSQSFGAVSYNWDFGDGRIGQGMLTTNRYFNTGSVDSIFTVRLIARSLYDCNDTIEKDILVRPTPIPNFDPTPLVQTFPNSTVTFTNTSNPGNWSYKWDFDDSTFSNVKDPGVKTYDSWGQYIVKLVASTAYCSDSVNKFITIRVPNPEADFTDSAAGCQPLEVSFQSNSLYARTFEWDFGDGGKSSSENPTHIYFNEGEYDVTLTVTGFEKNLFDTESKSNYVKVFKRPIAGFIINKEKVFIPNDPVVFSNSTFNADSYLWNFGDGGTSTERSPVYFYKTTGEFNPFLIASSDNGCVDTAYAPAAVFAELKGEVNVPNAFTPNRNGSNGGKVNLNPSSGEINDVFYAKLSGTTKYELNIFNKWGELIFVSQDINIGWDGYYRNELCKQDVYVWKIKAEFADGTSFVKVGDLMLLR